MQSFASGGAGTPFASTTAVEVSFAPAGNISSTNVQAALQELDNEKVAKAGDTMTGFLVLNAPPVLDLQAATKKYVDDKVAAGSGYTDEMAMDAVAAMIKNGTNITWVYDDATNSLTPTVNVTNMAAGSISFVPAGNVGSNNVQAAIQELDNEKVAKAGDAMTGPLSLPADPTLALHAATKQYTDQLRTDTVNGLNSKVAKAGDTMSGALTIQTPGSASNSPIICITPALSDGNFSQLLFGKALVANQIGIIKWEQAAVPSLAFQILGDALPGLRINSGGSVNVPTNIPSTSPTTGAITVAGGVGIGGAVNTAGNVTIQKSAPRLSFDATDANGPYIEVKRNNVLRWFFYLAGDPETGSNVGSDFYIQSLSDAGASLSFPLRIERKTGVVKLQEAIPSTSPTTGALTVAGGVGIGGALNVGGSGTFGSDVLIQTGSHSRLALSSAAGLANVINGKRGSLTRWEVVLGNGASESGGNAGTDFELYGLNDAGGSIIPALDILRASGTVRGKATTPSSSSTTGAMIVAGGLGVAGNIYSGAMIHSPAGITVSPSLPDTNHAMVFDAGLNGPFISGFQGVALGIQTVKYLTISGGGEMAIGTGIAGYKLSMTFPGGGTQYGFGIKQSADTTVIIQFLNSAGAVMGNIGSTASNVTYNTSSDKRLKKNLKKFDSNKIIDKIEVYDFEWKETGERDIGVIAQDVYEVYPQAITHDERDDNWFVDYSKFAPLMLQELKSLRSRVKRLER